ncbi:uncharacterized protein [Solanum lycopersicum]|uniref:uncharacterized protein n=1 Tax=Solanum lycopersicum TaxID=4081 RepID=UPI00027678D3|nr:myb-like protein X [Solanum lycopersicum]XP_010315168.1 myb-like protein X [Solanum lycopersicum]XP_019067410.1 myb-like protein X [Solanum lycopersicum]XP_025884012.1 myb-like protein X [Solanum lycopersicum]
MYKQSPSRNHRSKGVKVKNVLQICLLLAVCFWLIYQVKHSHDKKKEFDEDDAKSSIKSGSINELVKLGRKDLPRIEGLDTVHEKHREELEDETVEEEEGNKPEEEDLEENNTKEKNDEHREDEVEDHDEEKNDEHREDGEDEVDDHDQEKNEEHREDAEDEVDDHDHEKSDVERDPELDAVDEDRERGEDNEKETEERDAEVNDSQVDEENSLEEHDHDEDSSSSHEAREEHYKADDASSAVTHDTVVTTTENESGKLEQEVEHSAEAKSKAGVDNIMQINTSQNTTVVLKEENGKADEEDSPPNTTNSEEKHDDPILSTAADTSISNSTRTEGLAENSESRTYSTELSTQAHDLLLQNGTQAVNQESNATVGDTTSSNMSTSQQSSNSADTVDDNQIDSNLTVSSKNDELDSIPVDSSNVSGDTEPSLAEKVVQGNATAEAVDNGGLPLNDNNATEVEKADTGSEETGITDEEVDASIVENLGDDLIDSSDSSSHLEEKHVRTDVETLPEIQTEGSMEDAAAE